METNFYWFYDIVAVVIVLSLIYAGWRKGALRTLLRLAGYAAAFILAFYISQSVAEPLYVKYIQPSIVSAVEKQVASVDYVGEIQKVVASYGNGISVDRETISALMDSTSSAEELSGGLKKWLGEHYAAADSIDTSSWSSSFENVLNNSFTQAVLMALPTYLSGAAEALLSDGLEAVDNALGTLTSDPGSVARYVETTLIRPSVIDIVRLVLYMVVFAVATLLIRIVVQIVRPINRIPVVGTLNRLLGAVLGLGQAALLLYILALVVRILIIVSGDGMIFFNQASVDKTILFRLFYGISPF